MTTNSPETEDTPEAIEAREAAMFLFADLQPTDSDRVAASIDPSTEEDRVFVSQLFTPDQPTT